MSACLTNFGRRRQALHPRRVQQLLRPLGRVDFGTSPWLVWCLISTLVTACLHPLHIAEALYLGGSWALIVLFVPGPVLATLIVTFLVVSRHTPVMDRFFERFSATRDISVEALRGEMRSLAAGQAVQVEEMTLPVRQAWLVRSGDQAAGVWVLAGDEDVVVLAEPLPDVQLSGDSGDALDFVPSNWRIEGLPQTGRVLSLSASGRPVRVERVESSHSKSPGSFEFTDRHHLDPGLAQATLLRWGGYRS
ncbi:MAG: hypothetical protein B7733_18485 [Myxococcales bacterium FL481]|nr:MAG: hypothetical protein B7733_18485 [Myxococcales bacterium FL481]